MPIRHRKRSGSFLIPWNCLVHVDCLTGLRQMRDDYQQSAELIFADPPFNIGMEYDVHDDNMNEDDYYDWTGRWIRACRDGLTLTGSMFVAAPDEHVARIKIIMDEVFGKENMRNWIVWHYTFGVSCKTKFSRSHTHILYYVRNSHCFTFNADEVKVPSARQMKYNDKRAVSGGKVPDNTWVLDPFLDEKHFLAEQDTWRVSRVCGTFKERANKVLGSAASKPHPCQMPEEVLERIIRVASKEGDVVLDPFVGTGTTAVVAERLGRKYLGFDISESYIILAEKRIEKAKKDRENGLPVI